MEAHSRLLINPPKCDAVLEALTQALMVPDEEHNRAALALMQSKAMRAFVEYRVDRGHSMGQFFSTFSLAVAMGLSFQTVVKAAHINEQDGRLETILGCSVLQWILVVAMVRIELRDPSGGYNFAMVFDEYRRGAVMLKFPKCVAADAFERLLSASVTRNVDDSTHGEFKMVKLVLAPREIQSTLEAHPRVPTWLKEWMKE